MRESEFGFERLEVWQRAVDFAVSVYSLTRNFPREEQFGLAAQMRRAAVSVSSNIAEGCSRLSGKDQSRFYQIAYGSLSETATQLHIAARLGFVNEDQAGQIRQEITIMCRMLSGLRRRSGSD